MSEKTIKLSQLNIVKNYTDNKMNKINPTGSGAVSIGRKADTIVGTNSIVLGTDGEAESKYSISIGKENVAGHNKGFRISGDYAVAIGDENKTYGENSVSIGSGNTAYGHNEVNIGTNNYIEKPTTLLGGSDQSSYSVAVGSNNTIRASYSSIIGNNNKSYYDKTTVLGNYNEDKNIALSVGIGTSDTNRKNGLELDWSGNLATAGDITNGNGVSLDDCAIIDSTSTQSFTDPRYLYAEDVINDLTHTDINVPLSANQGKVLNEKVTNIENALRGAKCKLLYNGGTSTTSCIGKTITLNDDIRNYDEFIVFPSVAGAIHCNYNSYGGNWVAGFDFNPFVNNSDTAFHIGINEFYSSVDSTFTKLTIKNVGFIYDMMNLSNAVGKNQIVNGLTWNSSTIIGYQNDRYVMKIIGIKYPTS